MPLYRFTELSVVVRRLIVEGHYEAEEFQAMDEKRASNCVNANNPIVIRSSLLMAGGECLVQRFLIDGAMQSLHNPNCFAVEFGIDGIWAVLHVHQAASELKCSISHGIDRPAVCLDGFWNFDRRPRLLLEERCPYHVGCSGTQPSHFHFMTGVSLQLPLSDISKNFICLIPVPHCSLIIASQRVPHGLTGDDVDRLCAGGLPSRPDYRNPGQGRRVLHGSHPELLQLRVALKADRPVGAN